MSTTNMHEDKSPYAAAAHVPLIKSPSLRVPPRVELPEDIHPLPDSVTPYFVYPFTLEPHVLTLESSRRSTISAHQTRRDAYLRSRENEKEQRKREALRKIAPGFEPRGSVLIPTRATSVPLSTTPDASLDGSPTSNADEGHRHTKSVMEDLVDQLAALDSNVRR
ncbi:hypothetical protein EV368DRAFT_87749 [Lentinula lateritia]|uniref:Uncharacterized protein n=1 Tax=Lentinula aff. lateritia TaxID=2804960 RepID=A0ACC1TWW6_9AGAR|nr:hypothetical protein F5876DRAFT_78179 [Lentinula aff. lateritia]KAJ3847437.1 hypothetical protein EV368DRAFT_87749 [Lentinula lateritia]